MPLTLASYNVLADSYIDPAFYPGVEASLLATEHRWPALLARVQALGADLLCLQEVEPAVYAVLQSGLAPLGYRGCLVLKKQGKPDGCATFVGPALQWLADTPLHYSDAPPGGGPSGHLALLTQVVSPDGPLGVANTHLKWSPPGLPPAAQWGWRQAGELLAHLQGQRGFGPWVACGDFNVGADSDVLRLFDAAGWIDTYRGLPQAHTCAPNRQAKRIDFIVHAPSLHSHPSLTLRTLHDGSLLPSADEPSDHLAIGARLQAIG